MAGHQTNDVATRTKPPMRRSWRSPNGNGDGGRHPVPDGPLTLHVKIDPIASSRAKGDGSKTGYVTEGPHRSPQRVDGRSA